MIKEKIVTIVSKISSTLFFKLAYFHNRGRFPNLSKPKDISEILIKRVVDGSVNSIYYLADKYLVRDFIIKKGYSELLTPLIGVYSSSDEINFEKLPERFAIKLNYGAGMNIICKKRMS